MQSLTGEDVIISELFDAMPDSVVWFKPVRQDGAEVSDFEVRYCNNTACAFLKTSKEKLVGKGVIHNSLIGSPYKEVLFEQCMLVWNSGNQHEEMYKDEQEGRYVTSVKSKVLGGIISITRDRSEYLIAEKERQEQAKKLKGILDASADGIWLLEAIRDGDGEVTDFRIAHSNAAGFTLGKITPDYIGRTLLNAFPHLKGSEQFEWHRQVLNTGEPVRMESTLRDSNGEEYGWFIVTLVKLEDNIVSSFVDITEKRKNEQYIKEQAELLNSIFEASFNAIFAAEAVRNEAGDITDLRLIKFNSVFATMIGNKAAYAEGACYLQLFPFAKKYSFFKLYKQVIETGESVRSEIYHGEEATSGWFDISAVKLGNNGIVVTFANVTESRKDKLAIEEAAGVLQDVIDSTQTGIFLLAPVLDKQGELVDFRFKTVNNTMAAYTQMPRAELTGKLYKDVFLNQILFARYRNIYYGYQSEHRFEHYHNFKGMNSWLDLSVKKQGEDLLVTFLDFTPLKKLQEEIAASAEKLQTIINISHTGIFVISPVFNDAGDIYDFHFNLANRVLAAYIGQTPENMIGKPASTFFPAYKTNGLLEIYKDTYTNNNPHLFDFQYIGAHETYFNIHSVKVGNEVLVTFTDYTALKKLQIKLLASVEELKNTNAQLEEFAYAASHDLQEPLRKIHYFAQRLRKTAAPRLTEQENGMFERMENAAHRMSRLIEDLLIFSQLNAHPDTFKKVDLADVVQQVLTDLETSVLEKNATITTGNLPAIKGDQTQLTQLFQNLLSNSLKYTNAGICPIITINGDIVSKQVNGAENKYAEITITDNGIGFEQQHAERIFKVFQRLHGQSEYPGTGIGLAIVQKVIQSHNGFIEAKGQPLQGAVFTLLFPVE